MAPYVSLPILLSAMIRCVSSEPFNLFGDAGQAYAIEVYLGHPPQKINLIVDTGSTTLAVASYAHQDHDKFFCAENSSTIYDSKKEVQARYSQGMWIGQLVSDFVYIPLLNVSEVRSKIAIIKKSYNFFMNGSGWQGLLGLAYLPVGAWGDDVVVESWLDSTERHLNKAFSFILNLCGVQSSTSTTHYGKFEMLDAENSDYNYKYRTPILIKRWYEIGVIRIRVLSNQVPEKNLSDSNITLNATLDMITNLDVDTCRKLNEQKCILDSGTTNIKLPDPLFRRVVDDLRNAVQNSSVILDEFWYRGEAACWPQAQVWPLPPLGVDLLSYEYDNQYFTLEIPPQNYMRLVSAHNSSNGSASESTFCYKLGLEAGDTGTVLGYTAMEGFEVLFNRSAGWIGFRTSMCGPETRIHGPYNASGSLSHTCQLTSTISEVPVTTQAAQWVLCVASLIACTVLVYLMAPCVKNLFLKRMRRPLQVTLSQKALVDNVEGS